MPRASFLLYFWGLNTVGKYCELLERLAEEQTSVKEPEVEVKRLQEANLVATSSREVASRVHGELADAQTQGEVNLATLQIRADAD